MPHNTILMMNSSFVAEKTIINPYTPKDDY